MYVLPNNLWLGVSVEMRMYLTRVLELLKLEFECIAPNIQFISFEPLLGDIGTINFHPLSFRGISWIIIGGESGPHHRSMEIEWARNLVRQAKEQGVAVWMKQLGGIRPGGELEDFPEDLRIREFPQFMET